MGPLLWRDGYTLYLPGDESKAVVPDYYSTGYIEKKSETSSLASRDGKQVEIDEKATQDEASTLRKRSRIVSDSDHLQADDPGMQYKAADEAIGKARKSDLEAVEKLAWAHPRRIWAMVRLVLTHGISKDVIAHQSRGLEDIHQRAPVFDNKVEHLWTTAQICSAMIMVSRHIPCLLAPLAMKAHMV